MTSFGDIVENSKELEWRIPHFFSYSNEADAYYDSPTFSFNGQYWFFTIYPNGCTDNNSTGYVGIYLYCMSDDIAEVEHSLSLKTLKGEKFKIKNCRIGVSAARIILLSELTERKQELVPSDVLTILCTMKYPKCTGNKSETCTSRFFINLHESKHQHDLKELFLRKEDCDVVIKVQGQDFPAHKNILKARSPVFACIFRNDMKEKATGIVDIEDCDPCFFSDFLCFLYCADSNNISKENVFSLFTTSDKYQVDDLRALCVRFMKSNLSVDTFCNTITLALQYSEMELIKLSTDFFIKNAPKIIVTVEWQTFAAENPSQSNELFIKLLVPENSVSK